MNDDDKWNIWFLSPVCFTSQIKQVTALNPYWYITFAYKLSTYLDFILSFIILFDLLQQQRYILIKVMISWEYDIFVSLPAHYTQEKIFNKQQYMTKVIWFHTYSFRVNVNNYLSLFKHFYRSWIHFISWSRITLSFQNLSWTNIVKCNCTPADIQNLATI